MCVNEEEADQAGGSQRQRSCERKGENVLIHEATAKSQWTTQMGRGGFPDPLSSSL